MAIRINIAGTNYPFRPGSLKVTDKLGSRSTAEFALRQNKAGMSSFQRGQEIIIYDDAHTESVDVSNQFTPYGAPGLLWNPTHDGYVQGDGLVDVVGNGDNGTLEVLVALQSGTEDFIAAAAYWDWVFTLNGCYNDGSYYATVITGRFEVAAGAIVFKTIANSYYGVGQSAAINLTTANQTFVEGKVYRISLTWAHSGGSPGLTTMMIYVDGVERASGTGQGWAMRDANGNYFPHLQPYLHAYVEVMETYMADFRLWSAAQSQSDIDTNKFTRLVGNETNLINYWKIDEGTGATCDDLTSGSHDGSIAHDTFSGNPEWGVAIKDWTGLYDGTGTHGSATKDYRWFTGRIESIKLEKLPPDYYEMAIQCSDASSRFDERFMNANVSNMKAGDIIKAYLPRYFSADAIGVRTVSDGPTIAAVRLQFDKARKLLDDLKKYSGYIWYVDAYKELRFHGSTSIAAPFDLDNTDPNHSYYPIGGINHEGLNSNYANRIIARAQTTTGEYGMLICEDATEIAARIAIEGGDGIYEQYTDLATVASVDHGEMLIKGLLKDAVNIGVNVSYTCRYERGLRVGMKQHIKHTELGLDTDFIITGLTFSLKGGVDPQYAVQLSSSSAYQEFGNQINDMVESKSNFRTKGVLYIYVVSYP